MFFEDREVYGDKIINKVEYCIDVFEKMTTGGPPELKETEITLSKIKKSAK